MSLEPEPSHDYAVVAAALEWLREHAADQPDLDAVAARVGLSPYHLQRVFARWAGVSPKRFVQHLTAEAARAALRAGVDPVEAALHVGLSGPSRLHDLLVTTLAVTPGVARRAGAGLELSWGLAQTALGTALIAESARGVVKLAFVEGDDGAAAAAELRADWPGATIARDDQRAAATSGRIFARYDRPEPVSLFVRGTQFQIRVWDALLRVPEGRLTTYGALARDVGHPTASRAVGSAVGANPIALLIPCHRVIRGDGALGGYRWGPTRKRALIGRELARHVGGGAGD